MSLTWADVEDMFNWYDPGSAGYRKIVAVREAALAFSRVIWENVPPGAEGTLALRKLHEATMYVNYAISLGRTPEGQ